MAMVGKLLHSAIHPGCRDECVRTAYLQFEKPEIMEAIKDSFKDGNRPERIIIHPYFLSSGMHVTKDIPAIISHARSLYPETEFIYTEPLGISGEIVNVVKERIEHAKGILPGEIEKKSFDKIAGEMDLRNIPPGHRPVVQRVIHATADFDYAANLVFHPDAVTAGINSLKKGRKVLTDVEMLKAGINKKNLKNFGVDVLCRINEVPRDTSGKTRAERAIESAVNENIGIVAVGNAPTALLSAIRLIREKSFRPDLVIGVPVGFVRAVESKALLASADFPFITSMGRKGGSPVAAAIVNALLKMAGEENDI